MRISIGGSLGPLRASIPLISSRGLGNLVRPGRDLGMLLILILPFAIVITALSYVIATIIGVSYESVIPYVMAVIFVPIIVGLFGTACYFFVRTGKIIWTTRGALVDPVARRWPVLELPTRLLVNGILLFIPFLITVFSIAGVVSWISGYGVSAIAPILIRLAFAALILWGVVSIVLKVRGRRTVPIANS